ncbi:putative transporter [Pseudocercospora fuligena]|uniref:Putative transporter n=1 Tax=Pseudocercospora fuligena TaxID=685502 RepID=A0A8H6R8J8_9PEZI|nr:putative transporter [Pseudocercospora fuligena]
MANYALTPTITLQTVHENTSTSNGFDSGSALIPQTSRTALITPPKNRPSNDAVELETGWNSPLRPTVSNPFSKHDQKYIKKCIGRRVVILLGAMYSVSMIDRTTIGIALIAGMGRDLQLSGERYNILNAVFFAPYLLLLLPSTVVLRKVGPRTFLTTTTLLWGLTTIASGFVRSWTQLLILRIMLGVWEAGLFPGCMYLLQCWFPRYDLAKANAEFFLIGLIPAAMSGMNAAGVSKLEGLGSGPGWWGVHNHNIAFGYPAYSPPPNATAPVANPNAEYGPGLAGWRWIFLLNGGVTCLTSIVAFFLIVDFPEKIMQGARSYVKFLTKEEAAWVVDRIDRDREDVLPTPFILSDYLRHIWDLKIWSFAALHGLSAFVGYAVAFALPVMMIENMNFMPPPKAMALTAPPYIFGAIAGRVCAHFSDKLKLRSPFLIANYCWVIVGLSMMAFATNNITQYVGVFFAVLPNCANVPAILTWQANNIRGQWRRALVSAFSIGSGAAGGLVGAFAFRMYDKPHFYHGYGLCIGAMVLSIVIILLLDLMFWKANKRAGLGGTEGLAGFQYTL